MRDRSPTQKGRAGEHYVCFLIERAGLEAVRVDGRADLHVTLPSGRILRVEVKTSTKIHNRVYKFHIGNSKADVFALVAFSDTPTVRFFTTADAPKWSLPVADFTEDKQAQDLDWLVGLS